MSAWTDYGTFKHPDGDGKYSTHVYPMDNRKGEKKVYWGLLINGKHTAEGHSDGIFNAHRDARSWMNEHGYQHHSEMSEKDVRGSKLWEQGRDT